MNPKALLVTALCLTLQNHALRAGEARVEPGGALRLVEAGTCFGPCAFLPDWSGKSASGGFSPEADGSYTYTIGFGRDAATITGRSRYVATADGSAINATWELTPDRDVTLNSLALQASFPLAQFAGTIALCDAEVIPFPAEAPADPTFFRRRITSLILRDAQGTERLSLVFAQPTDVQLQDNRRWNWQDVSMRINIATGTLPANTPQRLAMRIACGAPMTVSPIVNTVMKADDNWIPLTLSPDIEPGSALDFSTLLPHDAPAGKHGYVVAKGPHFEFENLPGVPQRFYGVNFCFNANFIDRPAAQRLAKHLARIGYNAIRIHHHDGGMTRGSPDGTTLNPEAMDKLDGLIAACIEEGLYVTTDLYVSRPIPYRACGVDQDGFFDGEEVKILIQFHDGLYQNYLRFAQQFLQHVNPYTGRAYAQEPALSWIAFINEANLGNYGTGVFRRHPECVQAWKSWLATQKSAHPETYANTPETIPENLWDYAAPGVPEFIAFLRDHETQFAARTTAFLRDTLHCRALTANMSNWFYPVAYQIPRSEAYDYVDDHFYVEHPRFLGQSWRLPSSCQNANPVMGTSMGTQGLNIRRLLNRPFAITEFNYAAPGRFRGAGGLISGSMAALQDWAAIWRFAWSHNPLGMEKPHEREISYFDLAGDPLVQASERAFLCLYLRRDLPELQRTYAFTIPQDLPIAEAAKPCRADWIGASWSAKVGGIVGTQLPPNTIHAGTITQALAQSLPTVQNSLQNPALGDGAIAIDPTLGTFTVQSPRTCGGFAEKGTLTTDAFTLTIEGAPATLWASSLDPLPLRESSRILVTHLTDVQDTGMTYASEDRTILLSWGSTPHLMQRGSATLALHLNPGSFTVYPLQPNGSRLPPIPASYSNGTLTFTANTATNPNNATYLYEIIRQ